MENLGSKFYGGDDDPIIIDPVFILQEFPKYSVKRFSFAVTYFS